VDKIGISASMPNTILVFGDLSMSSWPRFIGKAMAVALVVGLATFAAAPSAQASELDFRYTLPVEGSVLSGTFDGTLLSGGNDFEVTSVSSLFVNGVAVALPTLVESADEAYAGGSTPAEVSLDGSYMNLFVSDNSDAFAFAVGDQAAAGFGFPAAGATSGYGGSGFFENYSSADWSASVGTVPEPSSFALLSSGVLGLVGVARRKFSHI
jgi:PEP-CTERM motif